MTEHRVVRIRIPLVPATVFVTPLLVHVLVHKKHIKRIHCVPITNVLFPVVSISKRRRSNVAVSIVRILFIGSFLFYCLLSNHIFPTNPNKITNCFKLFSLLQFYNYICSCFPAILIFEQHEIIMKTKINLFLFLLFFNLHHHVV